MEDEKEPLDVIEDGKLPDEPDEQIESEPETKDEGAEDSPATDDASQDDGDDATDDDADGEGGKLPPKAQSKVDKRIAKATFKQREAERKQQEAERRAVRAEASLQARQEPSTDLTAPDPSKYVNGDQDANYVADLAVFKSDQRAEARRQETAKRDEDQRKQDAVTEWQGKVSEAASRYDDFEAVALKATLPVSPAMGEAIQASDVGADVLYHLGQHPEDARRISTLPAIKQAIEIGKIEALIEGGSSPEPLPKKLTTAPDPAKRLKGSVTPSKDPAKMTNEEYRAMREKKTA